MLICSFVLFFTLNVSLAATAPVKKNMEMTLAEAINVALRMNQSVKSAYLNRVKEKFDLRVAQDKFNPNVDLNTQAFYRGAIRKTDQDKRQLTGTELAAGLRVTQMIKTGGQFQFAWYPRNQWDKRDYGSGSSDTLRRDNNTWSVRFIQPLLKGAGIDVNTASVTLAEIKEQTRLLSLKDSISTTVGDTITAFRSYAQSTRQLEIIASSLQRARDLMEMNKVLISDGRMQANELIQAEFDVASQEVAHETALNDLDSSRLNLLKILNMDKSTMIIPKEEGEPTAVHPNFDRCLEIAFENRSDYLVENMEIHQAKIMFSLAENNMLWDLNFIGDYAIGYTNTNQTYERDSEDQEWTLGLNLSIPIYGDLTRKQKLVTAQVNLDKTQLSLDEITEHITIEIQDAIREVETKLKQVGMTQRVKTLSQKRLEVEGEKLQQGKTTNFQMVTFQNDLVNAQKEELNANIAFRNALTSLDQILGTTLNTWKIDYNKEYDKWPGFMGRR